MKHAILRQFFPLLVLLVLTTCASARADLTADLQSSKVDERLAAATRAQVTSKITPAALAQLREIAIKDEEPEVRAAACMALGEHRLEAAKTIPVLIKACADGAQFNGKPVYSFAGPALAKFEKQSIPYLRDMLTSDDSLQIIKAGLALDHIGAHAADLVDESSSTSTASYRS